MPVRASQHTPVRQARRADVTGEHRLAAELLGGIFAGRPAADERRGRKLRQPGHGLAASPLSRELDARQLGGRLEYRPDSPVQRHRLPESSSTMASSLVNRPRSSPELIVEEKPWRAETALHGGLLCEHGLHPPEARIVCETLDRRDLAPVGVGRERATGADRKAVEQHGARSTNLDVARALRAQKTEVVSDQLEQEPPRLGLDLTALAVDRELDLHVVYSRPFPGAGLEPRPARCTRRAHASQYSSTSPSLYLSGVHPARLVGRDRRKRPERARDRLQARRALERAGDEDSPRDAGTDGEHAVVSHEDCVPGTERICDAPPPLRTR